MTDATVAAPPKLKFWDTALYMLAVGLGIRWIAVAAAVGPGSLWLWMLALFTFFIPLAAAVAELTGRYEAEGGIYAWARDGIGPLAGFICGWFYWTALMPYFGSILYFLSGLIISAIGADPHNTLLYISITITISLLITLVQALGLQYGKWPPNIGIIGGWVVVLIIVAIGIDLAAQGKSATDFFHASYSVPLNFDTAILWGTIVFAYSGLETAGMLRNEIEGGMRTVLWALVIVGIGSVFIYIAGTSSFLFILPQSALSRLGGFSDALQSGLTQIGLGRFAPVVIGLFALSMLGSFVAWFGVAARLPFAAGIDAFLPAVFAKRNPKTGAPVPAILLQAGLMIGIAILSQAGSSVAGAYDFLVAMAVLGSVVPYLFVFWVYIKTADMAPVPGSWRPPGGKTMMVLLGWLGMVSSFIAIVCSAVPSSSDPHPTLAFAKIIGSTLVMLLAGLFLYWLSVRKRAAAAA